jgi:hypothetical protein
MPPASVISTAASSGAAVWSCDMRVISVSS